MSDTNNRKFSGYDFYHKTLGSPKYIVAPMVDASELAWRRLSRRYGAQLVYTPMINAAQYSNPKALAFRIRQFNHLYNEEGNPTSDRPLIVQFCANDPDHLLASAMVIEDYCDAVDLNLGCPQDIAKRGKYGAFLMEEWELIYRLINTLHRNLRIPVTAKFRVFKDIDKSVKYAKMLEYAGAQMLTVHGRTREQRGVKSGVASWPHIRAIKRAVNVPVIANGNVLTQSDVHALLAFTGADGVMSAEGNLYNPALYNGISSSHTPAFPPKPDYMGDAAYERLEKASLRTGHRNPPAVLLVHEYLSIAASLRTHTPLSFIKGHVFKVLRPTLGANTDLRAKLGAVRDITRKERDGWRDGGLAPYFEVMEELVMRMDEEMEKIGIEGVERWWGDDPGGGEGEMSCWLAQSYCRTKVPLSLAFNNAEEKVPTKFDSSKGSLESGVPEANVEDSLVMG